MHGMADKDKSREVITDEISYRKDIKEFNPFRYSGGDNEVRIADDDGKPSDMTIRITADVGDALTGFKALQRELRETTKAARELERAYERLNALPMRVSEDGRLEPIISAEISTTSTNKTTGLG